MRGITVAELARRIGVGRKRLWYVLNGQREMRVDEFLKLCVFFNMGLGSFINWEQVENIRNSLHNKK
ncbi:helix-turn-helix domain-containing protein [Adlercreutzia equolifaciens]|nr:helix-turn-helix domain-containing protein [Adlercreutzia equolifaciens]MCG4823966.1 helix-turn-helix domain-containing protein [Adlercreutzia equolifaciens]